MANTKTKFIQANVADYNNSHYIHMPEFQKGMLDLLDRRVTILDRIQALPATGQPTRYLEQTKLPKNAKFVDPRSANYGGITDTDYGRVERYATIKCTTTEISFSLFDTQVMNQQGIFNQLIDKDMADAMLEMKRVRNNAVWNGKATSLTDTSSAEYCGLLTQISNETTVANPYDIATGSGDFVTDAIRTEIAKNCADTTFQAFPTALYANPLTIDYINRSELERKGVNINIDANREDLGNGFFVTKVRTAQGDLPLIPDPFIPVVDNGGKKTHTVVALNEGLVERHWVGSPEPQVFKMGTTNSIVDDYVAVQFDTIIAKGVEAKAHCKIKFEI